jgi:NAD(P)-dependent dehydrogenase (short-subunit alcohol dehydrogenase family)
MLAGVTDEMQLQGVRDFIMERYGRLDLLINNAGVNLDSKSDADFVDLEAVRNSFNINAIGPLLTARVLHPALAHAPGARIINIGSQLGSVERSSGKSVPYRMSKAALNMLTKVQAEHYAEDGIVTIVISPGWVRTDMGGSNATLSPEESVSSMLTVIDGLSQDQNGVFVDRQGGTIPF